MENLGLQIDGQGLLSEPLYLISYQSEYRDCYLRNDDLVYTVTRYSNVHHRIFCCGHTIKLSFHPEPGEQTFVDTNTSNKISYLTSGGKPDLKVSDA